MSRLDARYVVIAACFALTACQTTPKSLASPPVPANDPAKWVTANDYPTHRYIEGTAKAELMVGINGRITQCDIVQSAGDAALDKATCRNLSRRARFIPAKNDIGEAVSGTYSVTTRWEIPE